MVIWSEFRLGKYRDDDHQEDASHLNSNISIDDVNWRASVRWPLGPNFAWGIIESTTISKTHPKLFPQHVTSNSRIIKRFRTALIPYSFSNYKKLSKTDPWNIKYSMLYILGNFACLANVVFPAQDPPANKIKCFISKNIFFVLWTFMVPMECVIRNLELVQKRFCVFQINFCSI